LEPKEKNPSDFKTIPTSCSKKSLGRAEGSLERAKGKRIGFQVGKETRVHLIERGKKKQKKKRGCSFLSVALRKKRDARPWPTAKKEVPLALGKITSIAMKKETGQRC